MCYFTVCELRNVHVDLHVIYYTQSLCVMQGLCDEVFDKLDHVKRVNSARAN